MMIQLITVLKVNIAESYVPLNFDIKWYCLILLMIHFRKNTDSFEVFSHNQHSMFFLCLQK